MKTFALTICTTLLLAACGAKENTAPPPAPAPITAQSTGHYCTMNLMEHDGPKAQLYLNGKPDKPVWFSTIRQMFGYTKLPEEPKGIHMMYVTDMGEVTDWAQPNANDAGLMPKKHGMSSTAALSAAWVRKTRCRLRIKPKPSSLHKRRAAKW